MLVVALGAEQRVGAVTHAGERDLPAARGGGASVDPVDLHVRATGVGNGCRGHRVDGEDRVGIVVDRFEGDLLGVVQAAVGQCEAVGRHRADVVGVRSVQGVLRDGQLHREGALACLQLVRGDPRGGDCPLIALRVHVLAGFPDLLVHEDHVDPVLDGTGREVLPLDGDDGFHRRINVLVGGHLDARLRRRASRGLAGGCRGWFCCGCRTGVGRGRRGWFCCGCRTGVGRGRRSRLLSGAGLGGRCVIDLGPRDRHGQRWLARVPTAACGVPVGVLAGLALEGDEIRGPRPPVLARASLRAGALRILDLNALVLGGDGDAGLGHSDVLQSRQGDLAGLEGLERSVGILHRGAESGDPGFDGALAVGDLENGVGGAPVGHAGVVDDGPRTDPFDGRGVRRRINGARTFLDVDDRLGDRAARVGARARAGEALVRPRLGDELAVRVRFEDRDVAVLRPPEDVLVGAADQELSV